MKLVMEPATGKILAMVSKPDFNPNEIDRIWDDMIADDEGYAPYYYDKYVNAVENGESAPENIYEAWGE